MKNQRGMGRSAWAGLARFGRKRATRPAIAAVSAGLALVAGGTLLSSSPSHAATPESRSLRYNVLASTTFVVQCPSPGGSVEATTTVNGTGTATLNFSDTINGPCKVSTQPMLSEPINRTWFVVMNGCGPVTSLITANTPATADVRACPAGAFVITQQAATTSVARSLPITVSLPGGRTGTVTATEDTCRIELDASFPGQGFRTCSLLVQRIDIAGFPSGTPYEISGWNFVQNGPFGGSLTTALPIAAGAKLSVGEFRLNGSTMVPTLFFSPGPPPTTTTTTTTSTTTSTTIPQGGQFTLTVNPTRINNGESVTLSATGLAPASGRVDFTIGGIGAGSAVVLTNGTATLTTRWWAPEGPVSVVATWIRYVGGSPVSSTATAVLTFGSGIPPSSSTSSTTLPANFSVTANPNSVKIGQTTELRATGLGVGVVGRVDFTINGVGVGSATIDSSGTATLRIAVWAIGSNVPVVATATTYSGGSPTTRTASTTLSSSVL